MDVRMASIGSVAAGAEHRIRLDGAFAAGLEGLGDFSHLVVVWTPHRAPEWMDEFLVVPKPYTKGPERLGIFATRSPFRPNPLCLSVCGIRKVDLGAGEILLDWIDAEDGSPVLDLKPYQPSSDRIRDVSPPRWCGHWPLWYEESGDFDWGAEFNF